MFGNSHIDPVLPSARPQLQIRPRSSTQKPNLLHVQGSGSRAGSTDPGSTDTTIQGPQKVSKAERPFKNPLPCKNSTPVDLVALQLYQALKKV